MKRLASAVLALTLAGLPTAGPALATELVYQPVNPAFGGNPLNGTWLLNNATAQDNNKDPEVTGQSALDSFKDTLQKRILSVLAQRVTQQILGEDGLATGSYTLDNFFINVTDTGDGGLNVQITDNDTGQSTTIEVPGY